MLKVTETSDDQVKVVLKSGKIFQGPVLIEHDDYTLEHNGLVVHYGRCFQVGKDVIPIGTIDKVLAKQTEVKEVVVFGGSKLLRKPSEIGD